MTTREVSGIDLVTLVTNVREQLEQIDRARAAADKPALFQLREMELEVHFTVSERQDVKGGFDLKLISAGASSDLKTEEVQKVKLKWSVPDDPSFRIWGTSAAIDVKKDKGTGEL